MANIEVVEYLFYRKKLYYYYRDNKITHILDDDIILGEDDKLIHPIIPISLSTGSPSLTIRSRSLSNSGSSRVRF